MKNLKFDAGEPAPKLTVIENFDLTGEASGKLQEAGAFHFPRPGE